MPFQKLPGTLDLVATTWRLFTSKWSELIAISVWFVYFGIVNFALAILQHYTPVIGSFITIPLEIVMLLLSIWTGIRMMQAALRITAGEKEALPAAEAAKSWSFVWPLALTGLLQFLILFGATLLLIIPGIYLAIALAYSSLIVIDKQQQTMTAIKSSYALVKGRWWSVWWRELASSFIFGAVLFVIVALLQGLIAILALGPSAAHITDLSPSPLFTATMDLFTSIVEAATLPLFMILRTVIYRELEKTANQKEAGS